jgi:hypothetical protein
MIYVCIYTVEYELLLDMLIEMMKVIFDCICNVYIENMNEWIRIYMCIHVYILNNIKLYTN